MIREDIVYFKGAVLLLNQDLFIELFHEFNVSQLALVGNIHQRLPSVDVNYRHWDRIIHRVEQQEHDSIARSVIDKCGLTRF